MFIDNQITSDQFKKLLDSNNILEDEWKKILYMNKKSCYEYFNDISLFDNKSELLKNKILLMLDYLQINPLLCGNNALKEHNCIKEISLYIDELNSLTKFNDISEILKNLHLINMELDNEYSKYLFIKNLFNEYILKVRAHINSTKEQMNKFLKEIKIDFTDVFEAFYQSLEFKEPIECEELLKNKLNKQKKEKNQKKNWWIW